MGEKVEISIDRYLELLNAERKLDCLEGGGVDNWEGYDWSMEEFEEITYGDLENAN
jgi:hypothetical protein